MPEERADLPQGTLDLLILKVVGPGAPHGYAIAQTPPAALTRRRRTSSRARSTPRCTAWRTAVCWRPSGSSGHGPGGEVLPADRKGEST